VRRPAMQGGILLLSIMGIGIGVGCNMLLFLEEACKAPKIIMDF
jgi:hypothetical protein